MARVGIALGSNLGDRLANLQAARDRLVKLARPTSEILQAPIYRTAPVLCPPDSPDFYNTVIEIELDGTPIELLESTQRIERDLGRASGGPRNAPRIIDVDLLYFGDVSLVREHLVLPHPQLTRRRFVLQPLAEIRPGLCLPGSSLSIAEHLNLLTSDEPALEVVQTDW
jgi:2-amino-4-hydroxy-6-hydroxymethyldihydropteridine diphosphokinase